MKGKNRVVIRGNLTKDPNIQVSKSGIKMAWFIIAANYRAKDEQGNWEDRADFLPAICFRNNAEIAEKYLGKGSAVEVEGKLKNRAHTDTRSGKTFYELVFIVNDLTLLGSGSLQGQKKDIADTPAAAYVISDAAEPELGYDFPDNADEFDPLMFSDEIKNQMLGAQNPPTYE